VLDSEKDDLCSSAESLPGVDLYGEGASSAGLLDVVFVVALGAELGDGAEVVDHVGLGHTDTGIDDGEGYGIEVGNDLDFHIGVSLQLTGICERLIPDFIEGI